MNRPWMPLYVADYLADTGHLSPAEHGAYMLLIMHYWQNGSLPGEDVRLARVARMTLAEWQDARGAIAGFFGENWTHKRIDEEIARAEDITTKRRNAALQRGSKSSASDEQLQTQPPSQSQSSLRSEKDARVSKPTPRERLLVILDADHADAVIEHRTRLRKPMTERAASLLATELAKFADPNGAADRMIAKGWHSIDVAWPEAHGSTPRAGPALKRNPALEAANRLMEQLDAVTPSETPPDPAYPRLVALPGHR